MAEIWRTLRILLGQQRADVAVALAVVGILLIFIVPIPTFLLDFLMILNLGLGLLIILLVLYNRDPLEFTLFPSVLLLSTVFGLMLNVASTRLILTQGAKFQGRVVQTFARFVAGADGDSGLVTGLIIFIIIVVVQFMVITKGSTRISEVAARFALDAMPGKQMAIDAEFSSGAINEAEAKRRRRELEKTSDFYGRMDGATKFVSGSVKAGIVITLTNIIGGLITGSLRGENLMTALNTYSRLTIGDGLVSQIPALIISIATGLVVTQAGSEQNFASQSKSQFALQPRVYLMIALFLAGLALLPGFPWYLLVPLALLCVYLASRLYRGKEKQQEQEKQQTRQRQESADPAPVALLDPLAIELGYALIPLVDKSEGAELLERIGNVRREVAFEIGLVIPKVRIVDNMRLAPTSYAIKLHGNEVGSGTLYPDRLLALLPSTEEGDGLEGELVRDPTFQLPARWIRRDQREQAEKLNYTVVDLPSIITTHLTEIVRRHAADLLGRQEVQAILDSLKEHHNAVVEELNKDFSLGAIQKILANLLREKVSIRNMVRVLESVADCIGLTKDPALISEKVRQALGRQLCLQHAGEDGQLRVVSLDPVLERMMVEGEVETSQGVSVAFTPTQWRNFEGQLRQIVNQLNQQGISPLILCSQQARPLVSAVGRRVFPDLTVMSVAEITSEHQVVVVATLGLAEQDLQPSAVA